MAIRVVSEQEGATILSLSEQASLDYGHLHLKQLFTVFTPEKITLWEYAPPPYIGEIPMTIRLTHEQMAELIAAYQEYLRKQEALAESAGGNDAAGA